MDDERTWEDRQDTLDYRQWKAEQDAERANIREQEPVFLTQAKYAAMLAEIEARKALADIQRMGFQECEAENATLRQRVAELEAQLAEQEQSGTLWVPLEDGNYTAEKEYRFGPTLITITGDLVEVASTNFRLRDDFRLCRRLT